MSRQTFEVTALEDTFYRVLMPANCYKVPKGYERYKVPKVTTTKKLGFSTKKENVVTSIGLSARPSHAQ